jgi:hypothetical protein
MGVFTMPDEFRMLHEAYEAWVERQDRENAEFPAIPMQTCKPEKVEEE